MADPLIEIHNATVYRGSNRVLDGFSLRIDQGESVAVLGPNGAGKSTVLKLLTRELYPVQDDDSYVRILGKERFRVSDLRAVLGLVSHDLQREYLEFVKGRDVVLSGFAGSVGLHGVDHEFSDDERQRCDAMMQELGIADLADRPLGRMSTGQQRRCLLARALVNRPNTLVLDEPTSGLDLTAAFSYLNTVRSLMREGVSVVLVTHHVNEIPPEVERVVLLDQGRVIADGAKDEVISQKSLEALYRVPLRLSTVHGFFVALPGEA